MIVRNLRGIMICVGDKGTRKKTVGKTLITPTVDLKVGSPSSRTVMAKMTARPTLQQLNAYYVAKWDTAPRIVLVASPI